MLHDVNFCDMETFIKSFMDDFFLFFVLLFYDSLINLALVLSWENFLFHTTRRDCFRLCFSQEIEIDQAKV
jgi:hypothetical protein